MDQITTCEPGLNNLIRTYAVGKADQCLTSRLVNDTQIPSLEQILLFVLKERERENFEVIYIMQVVKGD